MIITRLQTQPPQPPNDFKPIFACQTLTRLLSRKLRVRQHRCVTGLERRRVEPPKLVDIARHADQCCLKNGNRGTERSLGVIDAVEDDRQCPLKQLAFCGGFGAPGFR